MKIIPLSEGSFTIDSSKLFVPFEGGKHVLGERNRGSMLVEVQPFAVVTLRDVLLIDTGLGYSKDGNLQVYTNLEANGIDPRGVTKVLVSHLHKDHVGGISYPDNDGQYHLTFPNATYYLQKKELDYAFEKGTPSYIPDELAILQNNPSVMLVDGTGVIDDYIHYELSGGHCPFHQVFRIEEGGQIVFFGGDDAPQLQQMKSKLMAKYDFDGKKSMELRHQWWKTGQQQDWTFLFYHDIKKPIWPVL